MCISCISCQMLSKSVNFFRFFAQWDQIFNFGPTVQTNVVKKSRFWRTVGPKTVQKVEKSTFGPTVCTDIVKKSRFCRTLDQKNGPKSRKINFVHEILSKSRDFAAHWTKKTVQKVEKSTLCTNYCQKVEILPHIGTKKWSQKSKNQLLSHCVCVDWCCQKVSILGTVGPKKRSQKSKNRVWSRCALMFRFSSKASLLLRGPKSQKIKFSSKARLSSSIRLNLKMTQKFDFLSFKMIFNAA